MTLADRICVLRDGQVEQVGTPTELYEAPNSLFVAGFIGSPKMNFLTGDIATKYDCTTLGVRAEHLELVPPSEGVWHGKIIHSEDLGSDNFVFVDVGTAEPIVVRLAGKRTLTLGDAVSIRPVEEHLHRFGPDEKPLR
jgi:multiple sugar transport system ATP-binding protein